MAGSKFRRGDRVRIIASNHSGVVRRADSKIPAAFVRYTTHSGESMVWLFHDRELRKEI